MSFLIGTLSFVMVAISLFMILLVLIQRGRGGGLAGAFGGMGGQSAFGTRAGDMFTRITIVLAVVWVLLAGGLGILMRRAAEAAKTGSDKGGFVQGTEATSSDAKKADDADAKKSDAKTPDLEKSDASEADKSAPVENTDAPAEKTDTPAEKTDTPVEKTDTPAEKTDAPAEADPVKEVPADAATPGVETPATEPKP